MNAGDLEGPASGQDRSIVEALARETGREAAHVKELYEREFAKLEANAKVRAVYYPYSHTETYGPHCARHALTPTNAWALSAAFHTKFSETQTKTRASESVSSMMKLCALNRD
jgi:hypothetical protein